MLQLVLPDVVFKVYEVALSVLSLICRVATGSQFHLLGPPVEQIIGKCGDANKRVRAISMDAVFDFVDDDDSRIEFVVSRICKSGRDLYVSVTGEAGEAGMLSLPCTAMTCSPSFRWATPLSMVAWQAQLPGSTCQIEA